MSAAHIAASVMPEAKGSSPITTLGKAIVALIPGKETLATMPISAQRKPIGKISKAPHIKPFLAEAASFAPQAI